MNNWLLRLLDRLPEQTSLPPKLEGLRVTIDRRMSRLLVVSISGFGGLAVASPILLSVPHGGVIFVVLMFAVSLAVNIAQGYHSRAAVVDYARWLAQQPRPKSRITRVGAPYERQPPAASTACMDCLAGPGQRHALSCPSIPPEWFTRGR